MRTEVVRDDALHASLLRRSEQRALRAQDDRMYGGHHKVGALEQVDELGVSRLREVWANKDLHVAVFEVDDGRLVCRTNYGGNALQTDEYV